MTTVIVIAIKKITSSVTDEEDNSVDVTDSVRLLRDG